MICYIISDHKGKCESKRDPQMVKLFEDWAESKKLFDRICRENNRNQMKHSIHSTNNNKSKH